jgi:hypothetical protein
MTKGWQLCIKWHNGSTSWENLKDLKEANPFKTAEYAITHSLDLEPAFSWWVGESHDKEMRSDHLSSLSALCAQRVQIWHQGT